MSSEPRRTPLYDLHRELGARMVPFAGWEMPVQYPAGILAEHLHARAAAALFDVSHMGQLRITGPDAAARVERLVPGNIQGLKAGQARYTLLTTRDRRHPRRPDRQPGRRPSVRGRQCRRPGSRPRSHEIGPRAAISRSASSPTAPSWPCKGRQAVDGAGAVWPRTAAAWLHDHGRDERRRPACRVSRLGYTGEDGFEISVPAGHAVLLARELLAADEVKPAGLGARDLLRLEAGLCLYGHDIDMTTTPVEAGLGWTVAKRRREAGGFPGADVIVRAARATAPPASSSACARRAGHRRARAPRSRQLDGREVGRVTSGGFGPTVGGPVAMGYVEAAWPSPARRVELVVRGKPLPAQVAALPFVPHRYHR